MSAFSKMKRLSRSGKQSMMTSMVDKLTGGSEKKSYKDDRFWQPTVESNGKGYAVLRLMPAPEENDVPFVRVYSHGFQSVNGWYIDPCATSVNGKCPVCEANSVVVQNGGGWDILSQGDKELVRSRKRKEHFYLNVMVLEDDKNPDTVGKVYLWKIGKVIFNKILAAMEPEFKDEDPLNPFDFWEGANFKLKICKKDGWRNYDSSEFAKPSELLNGDDDALETVYKTLYDLNEFTNDNYFPTHSDASDKFNKVTNGVDSPVRKVNSDRNTSDEVSEQEVDVTPTKSGDMMDYFKSMAD
jgi:hypothetical protein